MARTCRSGGWSCRAYIVSNLLGEGLMIGLSLKVIWFLVAHAFASERETL